MGEINRPMMAERPGRAGCVRPSAARVPSAVARAVANKADEQAVEQGVGPLRIAHDGLVPAQRIGRRVQAQHALGEGEVGLGVEAERHDDHDGRDQKHETPRHSMTDKRGARRAPRSLSAPSQPSLMRSMPTRRL